MAGPARSPFPSPHNAPSRYCVSNPQTLVVLRCMRYTVRSALSGWGCVRPPRCPICLSMPLTQSSHTSPSPPTARIIPSVINTACLASLDPPFVQEGIHVQTGCAAAVREVVGHIKTNATCKGAASSLCAQLLHQPCHHRCGPAIFPSPAPITATRFPTATLFLRTSM